MDAHRMTVTTPLLTALAAGALALAASDSLAQYNLGDGRALENNLRVGSGGLNSPAEDQRYKYFESREALIYGRVTGLGGFRGQLNTRPAGDFQGRLGSDDSLDFRRRSLPGTAINEYQRQQLGQVDSPYGNTQVGSATVVRGGAGVSIGDVTGQTHNRAPNSLAIREDVTGYAVRHPTQIRTLDNTILDPSYSTVGLTTDGEGNVMRLTASPLVGLRTVPVDQGLRNPLQQSPTGDPTARTLPGTQVTPRVPRAVGEEDEPDPANPDDPDADGTDEDAPEAAVPAPRLGGDPLVDRLTTQRPSAFDDRIRPERRGSDVARSDVPAGESIGWRDAKPGEDVYLDLLRRMGKLGGPDTDVERQPPNALVKLDDTVEDKPQPGNQIGQVPVVPVAPGDEVVAEVEAQQAQMVDELRAQVDAGGPALRTLAGNGDTAFDQALEQGEQLLAEGKFFDAEELFVKAMRMKPGHPMPQVGRIHAQLGAGLNLSAAINLRSLLTAHPELIPTRYSGPLIPSRTRLNAILAKLSDAMVDSNRAELPLLVAYLAYQRGNAELVERSLTLVDRRMPNDQLTGVLQQVWTRVKPVPAAEVEEDAADPAVDPEARVPGVLPPPGATDGPADDNPE